MPVVIPLVSTVTVAVVVVAVAVAVTAVIVVPAHGKAKPSEALRVLTALRRSYLWADKCSSRANEQPGERNAASVCFFP